MAKGKHQKFKLYRLAQIKHYRVDKMLKIQMSEEGTGSYFVGGQFPGRRYH